MLKGAPVPPTTLRSTVPVRRRSPSPIATLSPGPAIKTGGRSAKLANETAPPATVPSHPKLPSDARSNVPLRHAVQKNWFKRSSFTASPKGFLVGPPNLGAAPPFFGAPFGGAAPGRTASATAWTDSPNNTPSSAGGAADVSGSTES